MGRAMAGGFNPLYAFKDHTDGGTPAGSLMTDAAGNLYGTAVGGGAHGWGVVFKLASDGNETPLHSFDVTDGASPEAALIADAAGNLYSTTYQGGGSCCGTVFKLAPDGSLTVLYSFCSQPNCSDGAFTFAGVIEDVAGNLYGTTTNGGDSNCDCGVAFKLAPDGTETVLHAFTNYPNDGAFPVGGLIADKKGNLYGTTDDGGAGSHGTVFKIAPDGTETVLHSFRLSDGSYPTAGLTKDRLGNLYGTTFFGGAYNEGVVFKLAPDGTETVLYSFTDGSDGANPAANVILDKRGNLYGTTEYGGDLSCAYGQGCGTVFKLAPDGSAKVLHTFKGGKDGANSVAGLIISNGRLYGTTPSAAAHGFGNVFALKP
jgi:uncharacterized repeat protein (TIGR03803 family)